MKKLLSTLLMSTIIVSSAMADIARVELGGGVWNNTPTGSMTHTEGGTLNYVSDEKSQSSAYAWMLVKHPVPVIPNLRLEYSTIKDEATVSATGTVGPYTLTTPSTTASFTFTQYDVIPYYNILDNTFWTTVDLGVDFKVFTSDFAVDDVNLSGVDNSQYTKTISVVIPMAYLRARVQIPTTDLAFEADGKYSTYDGSTVYDARVKVDYTFDITPLIQPGIEIGYRVQKYDLSIDDDKSKVDLTFAGVYAGIMLRF